MNRVAFLYADPLVAQITKCGEALFFLIGSTWCSASGL